MSHFFNPDAPIMRALSFLFDCLVISLLFILCCLPVFTIGAALSALYRCAVLLTGGDGADARDFFRAFGRSFKKATPPWLLALVLLALLSWGLGLIQAVASPLQQLLMLASTLCMLFCLVLTGVSLFPLICRHPTVPLRQLLPRSFFLSILNLPQAGLVVLLLFTPAILLFAAPVIFSAIGIFFVFFWPALTACVQARLLNAAFASEIEKSK